ncbi:MAG: DUF3368 domain-containing protein [Gemmatimonadales bacterium]|nr:MAG: DUF3368 domain-containing protein [Gemmatimonadales bacterium]
MTHAVQFEVSEETLAALRRSPGECARDLRLDASALGILTRGSIRLLLRARIRGLIPSLASDLQALRRAGFYVSEGLRRHALRVVNEEPSDGWPSLELTTLRFELPRRSRHRGEAEWPPSSLCLEASKGIVHRTP